MSINRVFIYRAEFKQGTTNHQMVISKYRINQTKELADLHSLYLFPQILDTALSLPSSPTIKITKLTRPKITTGM